MTQSNEPEDIEVHNRAEHPGLARRSAGWIEVIAGSMFSGKSEELIRRLRRAKIARQRVQVFKPEIDERYSKDHIVSHSEMKHESANVRTASEILANVEPNAEVVGIDEAQFFDNELIRVVNEQALGTNAATACRGRVHHQDARHLRQMRPARQLLTTHLRIRRTRRRRRHRHVRSALPPMLCAARGRADHSCGLKAPSVESTVRA